MSETRQTYSFGPLERRGIFGPIRGGQVAILAAGALTAILALDHAPSAGGALVALLACALAAAAAFAPFGGRTVQEWAPVAMWFAVAPGAATASVSLLGAARGHHRPRQRGSLTAAGDDPRCAERRADRLPRASRARDRRVVRALGPPADRRAGLPGGGVLAARPRRAGTAPGPLGPGALERRRDADPPTAMDRAHGAGPGRRAGALGACRARSGDPAAGHGDDRVLPGADLRQHARHPGARGAARRPGRRAAGARARTGGVARALVQQTERVAQGLEAAEVTVLGALSPGQLGADAAHGVRSVRASRADGARGRRSGAATGSARSTPGRWARARDGITTAPTAPCTPPTGSARGRGSTSRRCSWTRCSGTRARCAPCRSPSSRCPLTARRERSRRR